MDIALTQSMRESALELAEEVARATRSWDPFDARTLGDPLASAASQTEGQLAAACRSDSDEDRLECLDMARGTIFRAEQYALCARSHRLIEDGWHARTEQIKRTIDALMIQLAPPRP